MNRIQRTAILAASLTVALLTGCASEAKKDAVLAHVGDEAPPDFMTSAASAPLADIDGFSADVVETDSPALLGATTPARAGRTVTGQVIGRKGRLIFQPWSTALVKKERITRGGMYFIWDLSNHRGFVVSEALQGFAQIIPPVQATNVTAENTASVSESVNGHLCHKIESMAALSDGSSARITEWCADDLQRFPVRIHLSSSSREETVDFMKVRLDLPAPELFLPPSDFARYDSSTSLINELMIREASLKKGSTVEGPGSGLFNPASARSGTPGQPY